MSGGDRADAGFGEQRRPVGITATGVRGLLEAYERLSIPEVMLRALPTGMPVTPQLAADHLALVTRTSAVTCGRQAGRDGPQRAGEGHPGAGSAGAGGRY